MHYTYIYSLRPHPSYAHSVVNFTLNMVGGTNGGPVTNTTWSKSFHGDSEIEADKYQLCARTLEPNFGIGTYQWVNFTSCLNGYAGIEICVLGYLPGDIQAAAKVCAEATGFSPSALDACVNGDIGTALYKKSVFYTSDEIAAKRVPEYGTGKDQGIPIMRINGVVHDGPTGAYWELGEAICKAAGGGAPKDCGCLKPACDHPAGKY